MTTLNDTLATLVSKDRITAEDVLLVRGVIYPDMTISPDEAQALFAINDTARSTSPEWRQLFVEALTDYIVHQQAPADYVDDAQARWLVERIGVDGRIKTETELELLIHVLEVATDAPAMLSELALDQIAAFALTPERRAGDGPALTAEEVNRIRRVLYAFAGDGGPAAISRKEAALLFRLNEAARGRANAPAWRELFAQAIGAAIMATATYTPPDRETAARLESWLERPTEGVGSLLAKTLQAAIKGPGLGLRAMMEDDLQSAHGREVERDIAAAQPVTADEARWLAAQIGRDGVFDDNEVALLQFVDREAAEIDPALETLVAKARDQINGIQSIGQPMTFGRRGVL